MPTLFFTARLTADSTSPATFSARVLRFSIYFFIDFTIYVSLQFVLIMPPIVYVTTFALALQVCVGHPESTDSCTPRRIALETTQFEVMCCCADAWPSAATIASNFGLVCAAAQSRGLQRENSSEPILDQMLKVTDRTARRGFLLTHQRRCPGSSKLGLSVVPHLRKLLSAA